MESLIVTVALPRSGSTFLQNLFIAASGGRIVMASTWPPAREGLADDQALSARTHDHSETPCDPALDAFFIIQHREPRGRALSAAERLISRKLLQADASRDYWRGFLKGQRKEAVAFYEKWLAAPPPRSVTIDYDQVQRQPMELLSDLFRRVGIERSDRDIQATFDRLGHLRNTWKGSYAPRDLNVSPFIPTDLLDEYASAVRRRCPIWR